MDVYQDPPSYSTDLSFIESFVIGEEVEDESLEWLSTYVEKCLCDSTTSYTTPLTCTTTDSSSSKAVLPTKSLLSSSQGSKALLPTKSRSKRRRMAPKKFSLDSYQSLFHFTASSPDPLLHYQTCWLAESELLVPIRREEDKPPEKQLDDDEEFENERSLVEQQQQQQQQQQPIRRCAHCLSNKTPQWRAGPMGPKTLCNACGVSYKKGRLLPEYRPAKSPTFVSYKHSNSYKKVMEMRMAVVASGAK